MHMELSPSSVANRRLFLQNIITLFDFSDPAIAPAVSLDRGLDSVTTEPLPSDDLVSVGTHALRMHAASAADGSACHTMTFTVPFSCPQDLSRTPTLSFAFSAYDGEHDSLYFKNLLENMYYETAPDPLLVSRSFITVTLLGGQKEVSRTIQLTGYGFNRIFAGFAGEDLSAVTAVRFTYTIDEKVPQWQRVIKLDTVRAGMEVDFNLHGKGLDVLFSAENGTVTHENGALTFTYTKDAALTLPDLDAAADTLCDVWLPVKNTVLLRLKATVPTLTLTVAFRTDRENRFTPDKQKTFTVRHAETEQTVFLNLSDIPKADGRLTGLRLIPDGSGTLTIRKISFEQEQDITPSAGRFTACTGDGETVTLTAALTEPAPGDVLEIYDVFPSDLREDAEALAAYERVAMGAVTGNTLTLTAPMKRRDSTATRIADQFLGVVRHTDGTVTPLADRTVITNWRDLCGDNPYAFTLPALDYTVTDPAFGAKGDGFTDDTEAIQSAIDAAARTGGRVVIPGDVTAMDGTAMDGDAAAYGRRYIITNLRMRSNVELHIEENAILWQADDPALYPVPPRFGHNVAMTGTNWPANHTSGNMPMIYAFRLRNVKVTGPGTLRMCDTESHSRDGWFSFIGDNVCIGCCDRMHVNPLAIIECDGYEVTDLRIIRSSAIYMALGGSRHGFIGNVYLGESKCTGADGLWPCGSDGTRITRVIMNNNDDGICLSGNYNDPRDMLWNFSYPGTFHGTKNIELSHSRFNCFTFTAHAISFCTWGTDAPDLQDTEVSGVHIYDSVLEGRISIGGWLSNPYYASAPDNFSPVKDVFIHDVELRSPVDLQPLRITNLQTDFPIFRPTDFEYGDFTRRTPEQNPHWNTGLSNWSTDTPGSVRQINLYGDNCACVRPPHPADGDKANLWQGLWLTKGAHTLHFRYKAGGTFRAFVRQPLGCTGNDPCIPVASASFTQAPGGYFKGRDWQEGTLTFTAPEDALYQLGVEATTDQTVCLYVTGFCMTV